MTTPLIELIRDELQVSFIHASGPGGQNVNKLATAVQLRWDMHRSLSFPAQVKERLVKLAGKRMTREGVLVIEARRFRTQEANRQDAIKRLEVLLQKAVEIPGERKPTRPGRSAVATRLESKKQRGGVKQLRKKVSLDVD